MPTGVYDDEKETSLIVDYGNVYQQLEKAYSVYGKATTDKKTEVSQTTNLLNSSRPCPEKLKPPLLRSLQCHRNFSLKMIRTVFIYY
ncbi:MAG: hypothetical protein K0M63_00170 [Weeksellaceae bacterium]|nr:hypothetical protein [Weeksellaceae bacterium]